MVKVFVYDGVPCDDATPKLMKAPELASRATSAVTPLQHYMRSIPSTSTQRRSGKGLAWHKWRRRSPKSTLCTATWSRPSSSRPRPKKDSTEVFDDWDGIKTVTSLPDHALHRNVDKIVLAAGEQSGGKVKTAIACPPCIYGEGEGQRQHSQHAGARAGQGDGRKGPRSAGRRGQDALDGGARSGPGGPVRRSGRSGSAGRGPSDVGAESGDFSWGQVSRWVLDETKKLGITDSDEIRSLTKDEANQLSSFGHVLWGGQQQVQSQEAAGLAAQSTGHARRGEEDGRAAGRG